MGEIHTKGGEEEIGHVLIIFQAEWLASEDLYHSL